jgi:hypothetical protein
MLRKTTAARSGSATTDEVADLVLQWVVDHAAVVATG